MKIIADINRPASFFETMPNRSATTFISDHVKGAKFRADFFKVDPNTAIIKTYRDGKEDEDYPFRFRFEKFPKNREDFLNRVRYVFLSQILSDEELENSAISKTALETIPADGINLGHGFYVKNVPESQVAKYRDDFLRASGRTQEEISQLPTDAKEIVPQKGRDERNAYLKDFLYTFFFKNGDNLIPIVRPFSLTFHSMADDIYDLKTTGDIRDFFIEILEDVLGQRIDEGEKRLREQYGMEGGFEGPLKKMGSKMDLHDIFDLYHEKLEASQDDDESEHIKDKTEKIIKSLQRGDTITKSEAERIYKEPSTQDFDHQVPTISFRDKVEDAKLEREVNRIEHEIETKTKATPDQQKRYEMKVYLDNFREKIMNLRIEMKKSKESSSFREEVRREIEEAKNFTQK